MLRSLLLSVMMGVTSLSDWAALLKSSPFHDFFSRLWLSDRDNVSPHVRPPHPKVDRHLEDGCHRSSKCWYCRLYLTAMCIHLDAWHGAA